MPTYDYVCNACGHQFELFQSMSDGPKKKCPDCGKLKLQRLIGAGAGFLFKGEGYYLTDYRSDSYKKDAKADSKPAEKSTESSGKKDGGSKSKDSKAATSKPSKKSSD